MREHDFAADVQAQSQAPGLSSLRTILNRQATLQRFKDARQVLLLDRFAVVVHRKMNFQRRRPHLHRDCIGLGAVQECVAQKVGQQLPHPALIPAAVEVADPFEIERP